MSRETTQTGGRAATTGVIPGDYVLSVGHPARVSPADFRWHPLVELARLESGHTPSRRFPSYWGGEIPWIGIRDATANHGRIIFSTNESTNELGIANSSARILPAGTVCLSRTASVGYVVIMGVPMATSQDFVNWVCGPELRSRYLGYLFQLEQESVRRFAHGTTHQTVYYPEAKAFHVCIPSAYVQDGILGVLEALDDKIEVDRMIIRSAEALATTIMDSLDPRVWCPLGDLADHVKSQIDPAGVDEPLVAHYSIPAFDQYGLPEIVEPESIRSVKFLISEGSVLISKLNPTTPRVWYVDQIGPHPAIASTEFLVLHPKLPLGLEETWAACRNGNFLAELSSKVTGTSNSHQRVNPADVLASRVPDPRALTEAQCKSIRSSVYLANKMRHEARVIADLRDSLLPKLMTGEIRVRDAERIVEDVT